MNKFILNTSELSNRAFLLRQHGKTLHNLSRRLNLQVNVYNARLQVDFQRHLRVRSVVMSLNTLGNRLINIGNALDSIADSVLYRDNADEEYIIQMLSEIDNVESSIRKINNSYASTTNGNYWSRSFDMIVKGDYSSEFTWLGLGGNIALGFTPIGWVADGRDLYHAITHTREKNFWGNVGAIGLGLLAFIPLVGDIKHVKHLKHADEVGDIVKQVNKFDNTLKGVTQNGDEILDAARKGSFKTQELLDSHFHNHASDFGNITKDEYLKGARNLVNSQPSGNILTKTRANGDILFYNKITNEFAVRASDGTIRTYFKPTDGISYFNRQK